MTYKQATDNYRNAAAEFGVNSPQALEAQKLMISEGKKYIKNLTPKEKVINLILRAQWQLKHKSI